MLNPQIEEEKLGEHYVKYRPRNKYPWLVLAGLAIWLIETWLFGWNDRPESGAEKFWDVFSMVLIIWGLVGDVLRNVDVHKNVTENNTYNPDTMAYVDARGADEKTVFKAIKAADAARNKAGKEAKNAKG